MDDQPPPLSDDNDLEELREEYWESNSNYHTYLIDGDEIVLRSRPGSFYTEWRSCLNGEWLPEAETTRWRAFENARVKSGKVSDGRWKASGGWRDNIEPEIRRSSKGWERGVGINWALYQEASQRPGQDAEK